MSLQQDLTYALRAMRKNRASTAIAVLALALGMGANTAIFSVVDAVLLNSIPMRALHDPSRLVMLWEKNPAMMAFLAQRMPVALRNFDEWKGQSRTIEDMTAFFPTNSNIGANKLSSAERPARVESIQVQPNFFPLLGVQPRLGRSFTSTDGDRAVLLSSKLYRNRFGDDPNLGSKMIRVDGIDRTIIGVLPDRFALPAMWEGFDQKNPEIWLVLDTSRLKNEQELWGRNYMVYGRLRPGATLEQARSEMDVIGRRLQSAYPEPNRGFGVNVFAISSEDVGPGIRRSIFVLQVAVGFVLLIACANVANLLLARAVAREREIAVRLALGAGRGSIIRLMLTESMLLGLMGGVAGLVLAYWSLDLISALAPKDTHGFHEMRLNPLVLGFSFLVSLGTGVVFGMAPAFHAARQNLNRALGQGIRASSGPQWARSAMVVGEVALALILLVGAGLMIRSLAVLMNVDPGFRPDHLLTMQTSLTAPDGSKPGEQDRNAVFCNQLLERVEQVPGVVSASISSGLPMESVSERNYGIEGAPAKDKDLMIASITLVTETFFRTMGIPIRRGRDFTRAEAEVREPKVIMVSDSFARQNWPNQDPLGKVIILSNTESKDIRLTVIGIVGGVHQMGPDHEARPEMYVPARSYQEINLAVRTVGDPMSMTSAIEKAVWSIDPQQPIQQFRSMDRVLHDWPADRRFYMTILAGFAGLALLLASLGLYGVLAYVVNLRTRELGIRMALGAQTMHVLGLVLRQGLQLTLFGVGLGIAGALLLTRLMKSLVFGVNTSDPLTFVGVAAMLIGVALLATWLPARRAASVDPVQALRSE